MIGDVNHILHDPLVSSAVRPFCWCGPVNDLDKSDICMHVHSHPQEYPDMLRAVVNDDFPMGISYLAPPLKQANQTLIPLG